MRFIGNGQRQVGQYVDASQDFTGKLSFNPQNFRSLYFALGSMTDGGSPSPYTHTYRESAGTDSAPETGEPLPTFQVEDVGKFVTGSNFVRTLKGCVCDKWNLSVKEGEPAQVEIDYIAQTSLFTSGAASSVTADTTRPFMWSDTVVHLPSGTRMDEVTQLDLSINNGVKTFHYLNGSRVIGPPQATARDYELIIAAQATPNWTKTLYEQYYMGGSSFNMVFSLQPSAGSRTVAVTASGCRLVDFDGPSKETETREMSLTIKPQNLSIVEDSLDQYFHAGSYV